MILNCILNLYPLLALKLGGPGPKGLIFPFKTWVSSPSVRSPRSVVQQGGGREGCRCSRNQSLRGQGAEPQHSASSSQSPSPTSQVRPPSHLRVLRRTGWCNLSPSCASGKGVWPHLSRDRLVPLPPLLRVADWRRLRSRHVRLLCCGLGDGVCLREEET